MNARIARAGSDAAPTDAQRFLAALGNGPHTFQTFADSRKDARLARILHGTFAEHADTLQRLNARGAGCFVMVNAGDGRGRTAENVTGIRAYFADLDGAPLEPLLAGPLKPHCIIESSPGHWHAYWFVSDAPLATFKTVQQAIAARFGSDAKVCDLPRVMRLPGFLHQKAEPFQSRIIERHDFPRYTHSEFVRAFGIDTTLPVASKGVSNAASAPRKPAHKLQDTIPQGERNTRMLSLAAGLVSLGYIGDALNTRMQKLNATRCVPPLGVGEVDRVCAAAMAYGSRLHVLVPHKLQDSPGWRALTPHAQAIAHVALRRAAAGHEPFALVHQDFATLPGFHNRGAFYRHRAELVRAGFLRVAQAGRRTQQGVTPDLYAIPPTAFQGSLGAESGPSETLRKPVRKVRKVDLALGAESAPVVRAIDSDVARDAVLCHRGTNSQPGSAMQNTQSLARLYVLADHRPLHISNPADYFAPPARATP